MRQLPIARASSSRTSLRLPAVLLALVAAPLAPAAAQEVYLTTFLNGAQASTLSNAVGHGCLVLDTTANTLTYHIGYGAFSLQGPVTAAHIHGFAPPGVAAPILFTLPVGSPIDGTVNLTPAQTASVANGLAYVDIHTTAFSGGEIRGQFLVAPAHVEGCFGDGSQTACPCGNDAPTGSGGCLNSLGLAGKLHASGFASIGCESLSLAGSDMRDGVAIYLQGNATIAPVFFGDGLRCAGGNLVRLAVVTNSGGASQIPAAGGPPISVAGGLVTLQTYVYQAYYRDPEPTHCPTNTFNATNAVSVHWVP